MSSSNNSTWYVFSDGKLILIQAEMARSRISHINNNNNKKKKKKNNNNNNNMLFNFPPASIQVQSNNEKQKSNNDTMDQGSGA